MKLWNFLDKQEATTKLYIVDTNYDDYAVIAACKGNNSGKYWTCSQMLLKAYIYYLYYFMWNMRQSFNTSFRLTTMKKYSIQFVACLEKGKIQQAKYENISIK